MTANEPPTTSRIAALAVATALLGATTAVAQVAECDRLAADPADSHRAADGVPLDAISKDARDACEEAVEAEPGEPRLHYQLARAHLARDKEDDAVEALEDVLELDPGYPGALYLMGVAYRDGLDVDEDGRGALGWFERAAVAGYPKAELAIARLYDFGAEGLPLDDARARALYEPLAEAGDVSAQRALARLFWQGEGGDRDDAAACRWYRAAADQGHDEAQKMLGTCYRLGRGVAQDDVAAVRWYRAAADQGNTEAMSDLGWMYEKGHGTRRDLGEALAWYERAAELDEPWGLYNLGRVHHHGIGVEQDYDEAADYYEDAGELGHGGALRMLGYLHQKGLGTDVDRGEACELYREAAELGNVTAMNDVGLCFVNGWEDDDDDPDDEAAARWFRRAADAEHDWGLNNLAYLYETGRGVPKSVDKAVELYERAAAKGNEKSKEQLARLYGEGRAMPPAPPPVALEPPPPDAESGIREVESSGEPGVLSVVARAEPARVGIGDDVDLVLEYRLDSGGDEVEVVERRTLRYAGRPLPGFPVEDRIRSASGARASSWVQTIPGAASPGRYELVGEVCVADRCRADTVTFVIE